MAKGMLFIGWGEVIPGREQKALQVFGEAMQYYTSLQQQGLIDSFEPVILEPHGGDLSGFVLLRGDREKLEELRATPEYLRMTNRTQLVVQNLGLVSAVSGEELQATLADYQQQVTELA